LAGGVAMISTICCKPSGIYSILLLGKDEKTGFFHLNAIQKASDRAAELIRQLLLFSRK
jgi:hypothetical protein